MIESARVSEMMQKNKKETKSSRIQKADSSQPSGSFSDRVVFLQRTIGNKGVERLIKSGALQAKLRIGQPGDEYEKEADRVADEVMRMPEPQIVSGNNFQIQRACPKCQENELKRQPIKEEEEEKLRRQPVEKGEQIQAKTASDFNPEVDNGIENQIQSMKGGGRPLSEGERAFFEPRFGADFSQVRVHTDAKAAEAARWVNARAFTMGHDVVFGQGEYASEAGEGRRLLGHELTHVIQQNSMTGGIPYPIIQRQATVRRGSVGCPVPELQEALNVTGEALNVDGRFGPLTNAAVRRFQKAHPPLVVDGVAGPLTWAALHVAAPGNHGLPSGEITRPNGWGNGNWATAHRWRQQLTPRTTSFHHCEVTEADPGGGVDNCHFPGSAIAPQTGITGGTWNIEATNHWGDDYVGWSGHAVTYYRTHGRAPCSAVWPQSMRVVRPSGNIEYKPNQLVLTIGVNTVSSTRDGQTRTKVWP